MQRILYIGILLVCPHLLFAMHIAEGFLPVQWSIFWFMLFAPFFIVGIRSIKKQVQNQQSIKLLLAVVGAFVFILSSLKLPSVAGSSSHLTGVALGAILFGASGMSVIGTIVLLFQALLLAHGGLTTLGANAFSMAVVGPWVAVLLYKGGLWMKVPQKVTVFIAAFFSDLLIYVCTSTQLALAFQGEQASFFENLVKFLSVFAITQLPLAVVEGLITVFAFNLMMKYSAAEIKTINSGL